MSQKPSVGRIVHVYTHDVAKHFNGVGEGPYAAMITQVFTDECVNCRVTPPFGEPYDSGSIHPKGYNGQTSWEWPPRVE